MILCIFAVSVVTSFLFLILIESSPSFFLMNLTKGLAILFIFSKNQLLISLVLALVFYISISFISALIFITSFLLLTLGFVCCSLSSCFRCKIHFSSVQLLSCVRLFATPWITARQASLSITNSWSSLRLTSVKSVMPSSHLILCRPLLLLPPIPPSIRAFSNEATLRMRWPKYWSFSFSIIPSKEIPGLISFRMDRLDLLAVQGTLKSFLQHHNSKASILWCSAFFTVQLCKIRLFIWDFSCFLR